MKKTTQKPVTQKINNRKDNAYRIQPSLTGKG